MKDKDKKAASYARAIKHALNRIMDMPFAFKDIDKVSKQLADEYLNRK